MTGPVDFGRPALPVLDEAGRDALFRQARTANSFASTPVTDAELRAIWNLAKWPPTSANTQPLRVLFVRTPHGRGRLLPLMNDGNRDKTASAPAVAVMAQDTRFHDHIPEVLPFRPQLREAFEHDRGMHDWTAEFGSALQIAYFIMAVRTVGLAAGPMRGFDADGVDREFLADTTWKSTLVINIGHPGVNPWHDRLPRLDDDVVLRWT